MAKQTQSVKLTRLSPSKNMKSFNAVKSKPRKPNAPRKMAKKK